MITVNNLNLTYIVKLKNGQTIKYKTYTGKRVIYALTLSGKVVKFKASDIADVKYSEK